MLLPVLAVLVGVLPAFAVGGGLDLLWQVPLPLPTSPSLLSRAGTSILAASADSAILFASGNPETSPSHLFQAAKAIKYVDSDGSIWLIGGEGGARLERCTNSIPSACSPVVFPGFPSPGSFAVSSSGSLLAASVAAGGQIAVALPINPGKTEWAQSYAVTLPAGFTVTEIVGVSDQVVVAMVGHGSVSGELLVFSAKDQSLLFNSTGMFLSSAVAMAQLTGQVVSFATVDDFPALWAFVVEPGQAPSPAAVDVSSGDAFTVPMVVVPSATNATEPARIFFASNENKLPDVALCTLDLGASSCKTVWSLRSKLLAFKRVTGLQFDPKEELLLVSVEAPAGYSAFMIDAASGEVVKTLWPAQSKAYPALLSSFSSTGYAIVTGVPGNMTLSGMGPVPQGAVPVIHSREVYVAQAFQDLVGFVVPFEPFTDPTAISISVTATGLCDLAFTITPVMGDAPIIKGKDARGVVPNIESSSIPATSAYIRCSGSGELDLGFTPVFTDGGAKGAQVKVSVKISSQTPTPTHTSHPSTRPGDGGGGGGGGGLDTNMIIIISAVSGGAVLIGFSILAYIMVKKRINGQKAASQQPTDNNYEKLV